MSQMELMQLCTEGVTIAAAIDKIFMVCNSDHTIVKGINIEKIELLNHQGTPKFHLDARVELLNRTLAGNRRAS